MIQAALVGCVLVQALNASAQVALAKPTREVIGNWVVTSSQVFHQDEMGELQTHYAVYRVVEGRENEAARFMGTHRGDGGETWETLYDFKRDKKDGLRVTKTVRNFEPVWELDPSGSIGVRHDKIEQMVWDGKDFSVSSSTEVLNLSHFKTTDALSVEVNGERAKVISALREWGALQLRVKFKNGKETVVMPEAVRVPKEEIYR